MNRIVLSWLAATVLATPVHADPFSEPLSDWQGIYFGVTAETYGSTTLDFADTPALTGDIDDEQFGGFIGYRHQFGRTVIGAEFDATVGDTTTTLSAPIASFEDTIGSRTSFLRLGAEAGFAFGRFLPYATAGISTLTFQDTAVGDNRGFGEFYGLGLDFQTGEFGSIGFEVLRHDIDDFDDIDDLSVEATTFGINFALRY